MILCKLMSQAVYTFQWGFIWGLIVVICASNCDIIICVPFPLNTDIRQVLMYNKIEHSPTPSMKNASPLCILSWLYCCCYLITVYLYIEPYIVFCTTDFMFIFNGYNIVRLRALCLFEWMRTMRFMYMCGL